jgi:hypothetical protein
MKVSWAPVAQPIILDAHEVEICRIMVGSQPRQIVLETYLGKPFTKMACRVAQGEDLQF